MDGRRNGQIPRRFARAAARFAAWRRTHVPHSRIPKFLWATAVRLAAEFGVSYTATRLNLNYYDLKKHVETAAPPSQEAWRAKQLPSFVELPLSAIPTPSECVIELENSTGAKMRIQIKGPHCPDLVALSAAFLQPQP